jgi:hypothetical protein
MLYQTQRQGFTRIPYQSHPSQEALPELLQKLHSCQPLRTSGHQHKLAQKALNSIKNNQTEDIQALAKRLANDVADTID